jgi:N-acetyl-gamma-glutamyl-phosphate reductase
MEKYKVAVVGAAGYVGIELVHLILEHPEFELLLVTSDAEAGKSLAEVYPALTGKTDLHFSSLVELTGLAASIYLDAVFLAVPHTAAMMLVPTFLKQGVSVFDLSADFRLKNAMVYEAWYNVQHTAPTLLADAIYGLPELKRVQLYEAMQARTNRNKPVLVACPGCYPTASALAIAPALVSGAAEEQQIISINALSGVSGTGKKPTEKSHFCSINENAYAYSATLHRHTPEIEQTLTDEAGYPVYVQFTPHLIPLTRGLLATAVIRIKAGLNAEMLRTVYRTAYESEPFVYLLPAGQMPQTYHVRGSNNAQVGIAFDARTDMLVVSCAIDNLDKGAASQAIQSANIVFGLDETAGLVYGQAIA